MARKRSRALHARGLETRRHRAAAIRHGAAMATRAKPTASGPRSARWARAAMVAPVVPHETAASAIRTRPARMTGPVYAAGRGRMTRVTFIGVGTMGLPMAKNLVKKGFAVTAFDVNP